MKQLWTTTKTSSVFVQLVRCDQSLQKPQDLEMIYADVIY